MPRRPSAKAVVPVAVCLLSLSLADLPSRAGAAGTLNLPARNSYAAFAQQVARVREGLARLYGREAGPAAMPSEIASEVGWVSSKEAALKSALKRLEDSARALEEEEDQQVRKEKLLNLDLEVLALDRKPYEESKARLEGELAALGQRRDAHNASPPNAEDEAAVNAYNDKASAGNAEQQRLSNELAKVEEVLSGVMARRQQAIESRAAELATRRTYLEKRKAAFAAELSAFVAGCDEATVRAQALAEIAGEKPANLIGGFSRVTDKPPDPVAELAKSVGQDLLLGVLAALVPASAGAAAAWGPLAAKVVVKAAEILPPGADQRTREVQDHILLIGDYAQALKRMKAEGRLSRDDPGYAAIVKMLKERGEELPGSGPEFFYQSEARFKPIASGLAEVAAHYAFKPVEPNPVRMTKKMAARERELLKSYGEQLKRAAAKSEGVPGETVLSLPITQSPDLIQKSRELVGEALADEPDAREGRRVSPEELLQKP